MGVSPIIETVAIDIRKTGKLVEAALKQCPKIKPRLLEPPPCRAG